MRMAGFVSCWACPGLSRDRREGAGQPSTSLAGQSRSARVNARLHGKVLTDAIVGAD